MLISILCSMTKSSAPPNYQSMRISIPGHLEAIGNYRANIRIKNIQRVHISELIAIRKSVMKTIKINVETVSVVRYDDHKIRNRKL